MSDTKFQPDRASVIVAEYGVVPPVKGRKGKPGYNLELVRDAGNPNQAVLLVKITVQFSFVDGDEDDFEKQLAEEAKKKHPTNAEARRQYLRERLTKLGKGSDGRNFGEEWQAGEQQDFIKKFRASCAKVWGYQHVITCQSEGKDLPQRVGVEFQVKTFEGGAFGTIQDYEHWVIEVKKTTGWQKSKVLYKKGVAKLDSHDNEMRQKTHGCQRGAVHELGHVIGLVDEYPKARTWKADGPSIMNNGEVVRPRHYTIFAHWLTQKYRNGKQAKGPAFVVRGVDGSLWDMANSHLDG